MIGLEEESFREYCLKLGIDPEPYLEDGSRALIYNQTADPHASTRKKKVYREMLKIQIGQKIPFTEKAYDEDKGDYQFQLTAGEIVEKLPTERLGLPRFTLTAIMPMEHVREIAANCSEKRRFTATAVYGNFMTDSSTGVSYSRIQEVSKSIEEIVGRYYGSGDYMVSDLTQKRK